MLLRPTVPVRSRNTPGHTTGGSFSSSSRSAAPLRRGLAGLAVAALSLSLAPAGAWADDDTEPGASEPAASEPAAGETEAATEKTTRLVRLKVARQPGRRVDTARDYPLYLLRAHGVEVERRDIVRLVRDGRRVPVGPRRELRDGDAVVFVQVSTGLRERRERVRPRTIVRAVDRLAPGERRVVHPGRPGVRLVRIKRTLHNGVAVDRDVRRRLVREPRPRRVLVGRRWGSVPGADGLNWRALANCESSGNPRAVNPAGYYGLYQFDVSTWRSVGGNGYPHRASADEQTFRAKLLYKQRGRSPWPNCGRLL